MVTVVAIHRPTGFNKTRLGDNTRSVLLTSSEPCKTQANTGSILYVFTAVNPQHESVEKTDGSAKISTL